jgi:hypothetical protein
MTILLEQSLSIRSARGEVLAELVWCDGVTFSRRVEPSLLNTVKRWIEDGLIDWVGEGENAVQVFTPSTAPEFLERLETYLARQFSFRLALRVREVAFTHVRAVAHSFPTIMVPFVPLPSPGINALWQDNLMGEVVAVHEQAVAEYGIRVHGQTGYARLVN